MIQNTSCRACHGQLSVWLELHSIYPSTFLLSDREHEKFKRVPLTLVKCLDCGLVQMAWTVKPDDMYRQYWYESGLNQSMVESLRGVVIAALSRVNVVAGDAVLDIGCNDGTMLSMYPPGVRKIGFDPARNLAPLAQRRCDLFVNDYFPSADVQPVPCKIVTSIAMFYDLDDPAEFVRHVCNWLHPEGIWVLQMADLRSMIQQNAFDNIVHEHLEYWSLTALRNFLGKLGVDIFSAEYNTVNGGSLRAYCCLKGARSCSPAVDVLVAEEEHILGDVEKGIFETRMNQSLSAISTCANLLHRTSKMAALGASTKGNTFLQLCRLNANTISKIGEINRAKFGLITAGSSIPIVPEAEVLDDEDVMYALVLPWHFMDSFIERCAKFLERGGVLIQPLPVPRMHFLDQAADEIVNIRL